jgi:ubiquinone/menaquinone biosynthesis C-methylase UbiE
VSTLSFDAGAAAYERFMGRWSRLYIPALLDETRLAPGERVLDVATGTGEAAAPAASRVGPAGRVVGVDISLPMLRTARTRLGGSIAWALMDGQRLAVREARFDVVVCQLGLMFFRELDRALGEFRRVLRPSGRLAACVWSSPERAPFIGFLAHALGRHLPAEREALELGFSLADPRHLAEVLARAGFGEIRVHPQVRRINFESFDDYWAPVEAGGGRLGQAYRELPPPLQHAVVAEVRERMARFAAPGGRLVVDAEALFALATR